MFGKVRRKIEICKRRFYLISQGYSGHMMKETINYVQMY